MAQKQAIFTLIGGRVSILRGRYAPTCDAVWLAAAAVRAKTILDIGIGSGGAALCALYHNPDAKLTGIDVSDEMLAECRRNAELNNRDIELINADITTWRTPRTFDLVITNPPYFKGTPAKHNAHHNADLGLWARRACARVRPRGHICIISDAAALSEIITAISPVCGDIEIFPLTGAAQPAERVIIRARTGTRGGTRLYPPISMGLSSVLRDGLTIDAALSTLNSQ